MVRGCGTDNLINYVWIHAAGESNAGRRGRTPCWCLSCRGARFGWERLAVRNPTTTQHNADSFIWSGQQHY